MTEFLTVDEVILIHDDLVSAPVIDRGKLEGAVMRPQAFYGDRYLFSSIYSQAAALLHGVSQSHGFLDGNKRTAWVSTLTFLSRNGVEIELLSPVTMSDFMEEVANGVHEVTDIAFWLAQHTMNGE